jgi:hypothetical protein
MISFRKRSIRKWNGVRSKHLTFHDENTVDYASKRAIEPGEGLIHWDCGRKRRKSVVY